MFIIHFVERPSILLKPIECSALVKVFREWEAKREMKIRWKPIMIRYAVQSNFQFGIISLMLIDLAGDNNDGWFVYKVNENDKLHIKFARVNFIIMARWFNGINNSIAQNIHSLNWHIWHAADRLNIIVCHVMWVYNNQMQNPSTRPKFCRVIESTQILITDNLVWKIHRWFIDSLWRWFCFHIHHFFFLFPRYCTDYIFPSCLFAFQSNYWCAALHQIRLNES